MLESFSNKLFIKKFQKTIKRLNEKLDSYLKKQDEKNIHDIRIAIRRFEAASRILPKQTRKNSAMQKYVVLCKNLFKVNTEIRDYDIICAKLEKNSESPSYIELISALRQKRVVKLEEAHEVASNLQKFVLGKINQKELSGQNLRKRFYKIVSQINEQIDQEIPIVISDEKKIDELHRLRKNFKKMRYTLELGGEDKKILKFIDGLKNTQDILGEIHDHDIMIDYLKGITTGKTESLMISEIENRHKKYNLFVNAFKEKDLIAIS